MNNFKGLSMIFFPRTPTVVRHCFILCVLILSESNCQAFVEFQESRPLFESLTRAKALSSLQEHLSRPVYAPFHPSSGVFNHLPVDRRLALGVALYSFAQAWQEWLVREVPNTPNTDATVKAPSGQSQSSRADATTSGAVASSGAGAFGGSLNQGSGGDDDGDKWPDQTDYAQLLDIHDKDKQMDELLNHLTMTASKVNYLAEKLNRLTEDMKRLKGGDDRLSLQTIKETLTKLNTQYSKLSISTGEQETSSIALEARVITLESQINVPERSLRSLECNHIVQRNGEILWKITNFNKKRQEAINGRRLAEYSPPALTQEYGYQFCAKVYLNGDGIGKGSHLSLFFVIMRGEYDALQTWPFRKKITFMILDQGSGNHRIDQFESDPESSSFKRPQSEMNIATGIPLFMPLERLAEKEKQYVKDDVMFIRIIIE